MISLDHKLLTNVGDHVYFLWDWAFAIISILLVFSLCTYLFTKKIVYRSYALYLLFTLLYLLSQIVEYNEEPHIDLMTYAKRTFQICAFSAYIVFLSQFVEMKRLESNTARRLSQMVLAITILGLSVGLLCVLTNHIGLFETYYFTIHLGLGSMIVVFIITKINLIKGSVKRFFLLGNFVFFLSILLSSYLTVRYIQGYKDMLDYIAPVSIYYIGLIIECTVFTIGLTFRLEMESKEKIETEKRLLTLQQDQNTLLNTQIKEKEEEIKRSYEKIRVIEASRLRQEHDKELSLMEVKMLRSQLNPHLVFNSLNTLKYFILEDEKEMGLIYLQKLSRYMRTILRMSNIHAVTLDEELRLAELYVDMENIRHHGDVQWSVVKTQTGDWESCLVPPFILQPFVENAFHHGLLAKNGSHKLLEVTIERIDNKTLVIIRDNGIGREQSRLRKAESLQIREAQGIDLTKKRLQQFYGHDHASLIEIVDLSSAEDNALGTEVKITFPPKISIPSGQLQDS